MRVRYPVDCADGDRLVSQARGLNARLLQRMAIAPNQAHFDRITRLYDRGVRRYVRRFESYLRMLY